MTPSPQRIFTLDARDNVMLEVIRDHFVLDDGRMHREIQAMYAEIQRILHDKGIPYESLKPALVPATDRNEAGFLFDSQEIDSAWYGYQVAEAVLPALDKRSTQSVLCGDLLGDDQRLIFEILKEHMVLARSFAFVHGTGLYCVYLNNLSNDALQRIHQRLKSFPPYLGYIPATYQSRAKTYLSTILAHAFIKHRDVVLMGHEDDRQNDEDVNMNGYPYEKYGYRVRSLQSMYFGLFLSFKIERAVYQGYEVDTEMSLNAVSPKPVSLTECTVELDTAKHNYLKDKKGGKLQKAGLAALGRQDLEGIIQAKIAASYIYNMAYLAEHQVVKFNLIVEVPRVDGGYPTRLLVALEYKPEDKALRVITLH